MDPALRSVCFGIDAEHILSASHLHLTVNERFLQPQDVPCTSAMKERIRVDQNEVEAQGFTTSSSLEIEITEPEGYRVPPPQKKEGIRGGR